MPARRFVAFGIDSLACGVLFVFHSLEYFLGIFFAYARLALLLGLLFLVLRLLLLLLVFVLVLVLVFILIFILILVLVFILVLLVLVLILILVLLVLQTFFVPDADFHGPCRCLDCAGERSCKARCSWHNPVR